jgi:hypothetical protein
MAITLPKKTDSKKIIEPIVDEKKILAVINKGGSPVSSVEDEHEIKQINIKLLGKEINAIRELRMRRPKQRGAKRLAISLHDWIIEAVNEKIARDTI